MKKTTIRAIFLMAMLFFGCLTVGWGQTLLMNENFSYTAGTLLTANGWTAHSGAGSNPITVTAPSATPLTYTGYLSSGIGNEVTMFTTGEDDNKSFASQTSGSVYASFLVNASAANTAGDYFFHFCQVSGATASGFYDRLFIKRDASNNLAFGISKLGTPVYTGFTYALNTTYLVVVKYTYNTGTATDDMAYLYINPTIGAAEPTPTLTSTDVTSADATAILAVALRQGTTASMPTVKIDGIRVATLWSDVVGASGTATLSVTPSTLTGFTYVEGSGPSTPAKTYALSGSNLTYPGSVTITGSTDYEVSLDGTSYAGTKTITLTSSTLASTTVSVRLKSGLVAGTYNGETIGNAGAGVSTPVTVTCSGTVTAVIPPVLTATPTTLTGFTYVQGAGPSTPSQSYSLSGTNLIYPGSITVSASTNFEVSADGTTYGGTATITLTSSTLAATNVYVRLKAGLTAASYGPENVGNAGAGIITSVNVACSGTVTAPPFTPINIALNGTVTENFDEIGTSATATVPSGWKVAATLNVRTVGLFSAAGTATQYNAGNDMSTTAGGAVYNFGAGPAATATDRGIGGIASSSNGASVNMYAMLHNNGALAIPSLSISYNVEKYRDGTNAAGYSIQMYYSTDGITWTSAGSNFLTSFVADGDKNGFNPAPGMTVPVTSQTLAANIAAGTDFYLAWNYSVTSGATFSNAQALGIDDVSIAAVANPTVAIPTFAPPAGSYYSTQNIVINCSTTGATIHYTTDGTDPTEASPVYPTTPIQLLSGSGTTTIKAKAFEAGFDPSAINTAVYSLPTVVNVTTMAALRAGTPGATVYRLTGEAYVSFFRSLTGPVAKYIYLQDNTGAIVVYDALAAYISGTYNFGDGITGLTGRLQNYNNMIELLPVSDPGAATSTGHTITPELKTLATITSADQAKLIRVTNVSFTGATGNFVTATDYPLADASGTGDFRTAFAEANYITTPTVIPTNPINLVCIVSQYVALMQLTARSSADMTVAAPTWTSGWPKAENITPTGFSAKVNINTPGTCYLVVLPNGAAVPSSAQVKAGQNAAGTPVASNLAGTIACAAGSTEYILGMNGLSSSTTYNVYYVAETSGVLQDNPVMVTVLTASGNTAPVVSSTTVSAITAHSAIIGGSIVANGGAPILEYGTVWSTTYPATITDHKMGVGATPITFPYPFTQLRDSLPVGTTVYFAAYARNSVGTTLAQGNFSTLVGEPSNYPQNFTAGTTTNATIPLSWTDALASEGEVAATGYLIKGSSVSFDAIVPPVDGVPETDGFLVNNIAQGLQSAVISGLTAGTTYFFKIFPYNSIGGTSINYKNNEPVPTASATTDIVLYENFAYTVGDFVGGDYYAAPSTTYSNNWTAHSGVGNIPVVDGSLSYPGLLTSTGQKITVPGINSPGTGQVSKDINRPISTSSSVLYYSVLLDVVDQTQLSTTSDYFMHFSPLAGTSIGSNFGGKLGIIKVTTPALGYRLTILNLTGTPTVYPQDLTFGTTYLVVVKYDISTSTTVATLWVNPSTLGGAEPSGSVTNSSGAGTFPTFGSICIRNGSGTPNAQYDEIRVGTTFAQVTPLSLNKTLNLTSVFMEGLYNGFSTMFTAMDATYDGLGNITGVVPKWSDGSADHITVELHRSGRDVVADTSYYPQVIYPATDVPLSTTGTATITIPGQYNGSYYLTIKQRNHIETVSALPVDFSGAVISYAFNALSQAYDANMTTMLESDGTTVSPPLIYGGDVNQDAQVEAEDMNEIGNDASIFAYGYRNTDVYADGQVESADINIAGNNAATFVYAHRPM